VPAQSALVTGFGPFESYGVNPSAEVALALARRPPTGLTVVAGVLPASFERAPRAWDELYDGLKGRPELVLALGVLRAGDRGFRIEAAAGPELVLVPRPDVDGRMPAEFSRPGPTLTSAVDVDALQRRLVERGVHEARCSRSAGGYVCERLYHHVLARSREHGVRALFVHVPPLSATPLERQVEVVGLALEALTSP
jgi:pyrrolidone-carboxylate peptidase